MMAEKFIEVSPKDVIWDNIDVRTLVACGMWRRQADGPRRQDGAYETRFRYVTSWMGSIALIILWFAPVAFVGTLSNVSTLCEKVRCVRHVRCWLR